MAIKAIDDEPEYPDEMPQEMKEVLAKALAEKDVGLLTFLMRLAVKQTKDGIRGRMTAYLNSMPIERKALRLIDTPIK